MKSHLLHLALLLVVSSALAADKAGDGTWTPLFNGKNLDGWAQHGGKASYRAEEGQLVGSSAPSTPNSFLCTKREYTNFVLELEFNVQNGLNSGVQIRSHVFDKPTQFEHKGETKTIAPGRVHGYQIEIDTTARAWTGGLYDEGRRGWLNDLKANDAARKAFKAGEWNKFRIEANGPSIKTWINGVSAADFRDSLSPSGFIALQVHGVGRKTDEMTVRFRNLRVMEMP